MPFTANHMQGICDTYACHVSRLAEADFCDNYEKKLMPRVPENAPRGSLFNGRSQGSHLSPHQHLLLASATYLSLAAQQSP